MLKILSVILLSFICTQANAHLLKVFAFSQSINNSNQLLIKGKVYFAGGDRLPDAPINIITDQGTIARQLVTDNEGNFNITLVNAIYTIVVNTNDGHKATWAIKPATKLAINNKTTTSPIPHLQDGQINHQMLNEMFATQLAEQIAPLSEQINDLQDNAQYQDIIGALGYIFGAFGLFTWFRQRKSS